jgi:hypothetical protein
MAAIGTIAGLFATVSILTFVFGHIMPSYTPSFVVWIFIVLSAAIGGGLAYGAYNWPRIGIVLISLCTGFIIGMTVYTAFMGSWDFVANKVVVPLNG